VSTVRMRRVGREDWWPFLVLLQVFPALVSLTVTPFLPDTPRYLLLMKDNEEAAQKCTLNATSVYQ